jgi:Helix-hairpin-helix motif
MISRCLLLLAAGIILFMPGKSQTPGNSEAKLHSENTFKLIELYLESIAASGNESADYESLLRDLEFLQKNKLDLNLAKREDLQKLSFLTDFQITSLIDYRNEKGTILSVYELQFIDGFTHEVISMILPFIMVSDQTPARVFSVREMAKNGHQKVELRTQRNFEKSKGYKVYDSLAGDTRYPGSPWLINAQYEFVSKDHIRAGITLEKDPGEDFFKASNRNGFDFNSAFVLIEDIKPVKSAIIGDYRLAFGQGLTLWSGAATGKSSLPMNIVKRQDALKAFTSNDENNYFRGIAAATAIGKFTVTAFVSYKKRDANITDTLPDHHICFSSFQESGYHRTLSEINDEKSVKETAFGGNVLFRNNFIKLGTTVVNYSFDKYLEAGDDVSDIHDFSGNRLLNWGMDYSVYIKRIQLFGESSYGNNHWATLHGALLNINKYASFSLLYRYFESGYFSMNSSAFSEGSTDSNEEGLYAGLVLKPIAKIRFSGYADFYHFPWLKYDLSAPASGADYLLQIDYNPSKQTEMYLRFKFESDPDDEMNDTATIPQVAERMHSGLRFHISYKINDHFTMQNRFEMAGSNPEFEESSRGYMIFHDIEYRLKKISGVFDFRVTWFNTTDYSSRIYAYEQDMTSGFSFPPLYDKGLRTYIMATIDISESIACGVRFSNTWYFNKSTIGAGQDAITSNFRNDIKVRIAIRI